MAQGVLFGGLFGIINMWLIVSLTVSILDRGKRNPFTAGTLLTLKIPVLYGILIIAFSRHWIDPIGFAIGFQLFMVALLIYAAVAYLAVVRNQRTRGDEPR